MKIEIRRLAFAFFWPTKPNYLDLETGEIYSFAFSTEEIRNDSERYMRLPKLSFMFILQAYMEKAFADGVMEDEENLRAYPRFTPHEKDYEVRGMEPLDVLEREYYEKAHNLCEKYDLEDGAYDLPGSVREYEPYNVFAYYAENEFAKKWCEEHGFDYYEAPVADDDD